MKHKWHDEIVAWAGGAEVEVSGDNGIWYGSNNPSWDIDLEYRIKPQPKEKKYLYVYQLGFEYKLNTLKQEKIACFSGDRMIDCNYFGKIEVLDD